MYDEKFGEVILAKKKKDTNDQGPISKKAQRKKQKNLNRSLAAEKLLNQYMPKEKSEKKNIEKQKPPPKLNEDHQKKVNHLKAILSHHKQSTILEQLKKNDFDLNDALEALMSIPQDDQNQQIMKEFQDIKATEKSKMASKVQNNQLKPEEAASKLINEFCDQMGVDNLEINPKQFDDLFQEITYIIKQDQKEKGVGIYEINDFVDNCFSIKNTLLDGLQEVNIDQDDPLWQQTQTFLQQIIKTKVVQQKKRQEQFPTLGAIQPKKNNNNSKNYIDKIRDDYKVQKSKQEYFTPSKVPSNIVYNQNTSENSIYNIGSDFNAYADIQQLSKEYNGMSIDSLKFIHHNLHDINLCKTFLEKYYPDKKLIIKIEEKKRQPVQQQPKPSDRVLQSLNTRKKSIDDDYKHMSLNAIRQELDHLFKIKNLFKITKNKTTNIAYRKQLQRLSCKDDGLIQRLCEVSRQKLIQEMIDSHPQYVDLHGYREEQIDRTFDSIKNMVLSQFRRGNSKLKTEKYGSKVFIVVKGLTGKGRHSRYGKSILKPALKEWASYYGYKAVQNEDSIDVYIQL